MPKQHAFLGQVTIGAGGASNATFSSIPQNYTDLKIIASSRVTDGGEGTQPPISRGEITFNGSGGTYRVGMLYGVVNQSINSAGGSDGARSFYAGNSTSSNATANTFSSYEFYIPNYTSSLTKQIFIDGVTENNGSWSTQDFTTILWSGTAAITSIKLNPYNNGNFAQYSTFTFYGITNS